MTASETELDRLMRAAAAALGAGDWERAEDALTACLACKPDDPSLSYNLALVEKRLGKTMAAERRLANLLDAAPRHANARFEYAAALMERGAETEALAQFEAYLCDVPDDADARLNAARLCLRLDRAADALTHIEAAGSSRPDDPGTRLARAEAIRDLGRPDEARRLFDSLYRDVPALRPAILKAMSQGRRGRMPLGAHRLGRV